MKLLCLIFGHDLAPVETLSPYCTKMFCHGCKNYYVTRICDGIETTIRWTDAMEDSLRIRRRTQLLASVSCKGAR